MGGRGSNSIERVGGASISNDPYGAKHFMRAFNRNHPGEVPDWNDLNSLTTPALNAVFEEMADVYSKWNLTGARVKNSKGDWMDLIDDIMVTSRVEDGATGLATGTMQSGKMVETKAYDVEDIDGDQVLTQRLAQMDDIPQGASKKAIDGMIWWGMLKAHEFVRTANGGS